MPQKDFQKQFYERERGASEGYFSGGHEPVAATGSYREGWKTGKALRDKLRGRSNASKGE